MTGRPSEAVPGYPSAAAAAVDLGVTTQTVYRHLRSYGDLARLVRRIAALRNPGGIAMPDGSLACSIAEAARLLGLSSSGINHHLREYGHLHGAGMSRRVRAMEGGEAGRRITLAEVPGVFVPPADPRPETAPRGSHMVSSGASDVSEVSDIAAVIATIRQCRDDCLAERRERVA